MFQHLWLHPEASRETKAPRSNTNPLSSPRCFLPHAVMQTHLWITLKVTPFWTQNLPHHFDHLPASRAGDAGADARWAPQPAAPAQPALGAAANPTAAVGTGTLLEQIWVLPQNTSLGHNRLYTCHLPIPASLATCNSSVNNVENDLKTKKKKQQQNPPPPPTTKHKKTTPNPKIKQKTTPTPKIQLGNLAIQNNFRQFITCFTFCALP